MYAEEEFGQSDRTPRVSKHAHVNSRIRDSSGERNLKIALSQTQRTTLQGQVQDGTHNVSGDAARRCRQSKDGRELETTAGGEPADVGCS